MTSVVDTSVKYFHSGMPGAPVLTGLAGSMLGVLDACLRDGFDLKSATSLVVAAGVATLSFSGTHSAAVGAVILVTGSSIAALNGEQKITVAAAGLLKFATAAADGTAAGTIAFKMAPAGWLTSFTGTNLRVYRSADVAGTGMHLRVSDLAIAARVSGYEKMTGISTGTGLFPSTAQKSGGGYWPKSGAADATPIDWVLVADSRKFYIGTSPYMYASPAYTGMTHRGFGDDLPSRPGGDPYACSLSFGDTADASDITGGVDSSSGALNHAIARGYTGLGSSVLHICAPYTGTNAVSGMDDFFGPFPSPVDGGLRLSKKWFGTTAPGNAPRSDLPGIYHVPMRLMINAFRKFDTVMGTGPLAGRRLMALQPTSSPGGGDTADGISFVDITGPWR